MTRLVVATLVMAVLGLTVSPADAQSLRDAQAGGRYGGFTACARILVVPGERGDCFVHICKPRHKHRHHKVRKHRRHRSCLPPVVSVTRVLSGS